MTNSIKIAENCLEKLPNIELKNRGIYIEEEIPKNSVLFIGINPSFDPKTSLVPGQDGYFQTYKLEGIKENHSYFGKAISIVNDLKQLDEAVSFGHHDLFPIRETSQKVIESMFDGTTEQKLVAKSEYKEFIDESMRWSENVILQSRPKIIVVINAFASRIFFDYKNEGHSLLNFTPADEILWCPNLGVDFVRINDYTCPIMFSGMLCGQRALDRGSEFRLRWHICHVLKNRQFWPE